MSYHDEMLKNLISLRLSNSQIEKVGKIKESLIKADVSPPAGYRWRYGWNNADVIRHLIESYPLVNSVKKNKHRS